MTESNRARGVNRIRTKEGVWIRTRMGVACGMLGLCLGIVVSAAHDLMVENGDLWRQLAEDQRHRRLRVRPKRGMMFDRNHSVLAVSVEVPTISLDAIELLRDVPQERVPEVARSAAERIAQALGLPAAEVEKKILARRRWSWLRRHVTREQAEAVRRLADGEAGPPIVGLIVEAEGKRYYPGRQVAAPLLGFVSPDGKGRDGLEYSLSSELEGHPEELRGLRDRAGRLIFTEGIEDDQAFAGHDVELTIDQNLQFIAERELENAARTFEAKGGSVVVVDPYTGELLAVASYPSFNPNDYGQSEPESRRNRATGDSFEPGSTMKIFTVAAALERGQIRPTEQLFCEDGAMKVDNVTIRDTHPAGWLPVSQVLAQSSNICAAKIGLGLGGDQLYESLRRFGFGEESGLPVPGESSGTLRPRGRPWVQVETASAAFGQGISVTNLQLAMATGAIANGGELMQPILIKRIATAAGELVRESAPRVRRRVVSEQVAHLLAEMLVAVTEDGGTGTEAEIGSYRVAGKTATAQKTDPRTGRYSLDDYVASFAGFVPAVDPVVAIAVTIDEPRIEHAGGVVAAPVFRRVAEAVLRQKGLVAEEATHVSLSRIGKEPDPARATEAILREARGEKPVVQEVTQGGHVGKDQVRLPDLTGSPMRSAVRALLDLGTQVEVEGTGVLAQQVPPPGSVVPKGSSIRLLFRPAS